MPLVYSKWLVLGISLVCFGAILGLPMLAIEHEKLTDALLSWLERPL